MLLKGPCSQRQAIKVWAWLISVFNFKEVLCWVQRLACNLWLWCVCMCVADNVADLVKVDF